jgi:hypothetical protein
MFKKVLKLIWIVLLQENFLNKFFHSNKINLFKNKNNKQIKHKNRKSKIQWEYKKLNKKICKNNMIIQKNAILKMKI